MPMTQAIPTSLNRARVMSWKNSLVTPPWSTPSSMTPKEKNVTRMGFFTCQPSRCHLHLVMQSYASSVGSDEVGHMEAGRWLCHCSRHVTISMHTV